MEARGIDSPRLDAEILIAHALGVSRLDLYLQYDRPLTPDELARVRPLVKSRGDDMPVAYLLGEQEFHSLTFTVDPRVLVPRPETELLVDEAVKRLEPLEKPVFADVGTGSGCIAVAVLTAVESARCHATDVSADALAVARENAVRHELEDRVRFHHGPGLTPLEDHGHHGRLAAVLSNPPYIVLGDESVQRGVRAHEPHEALFVSGEDPLAVAREVAEAARAALRPGGFVMLEVGAGSAGEAASMLEALGYGEVEVVPDLAGIDRVVSGRSSSRTAAP